MLIISDMFAAGVQKLDALVIPGGWCPDYLRRDKRFVDLVRNMMSASMLIICSSYFIIAQSFYNVSPISVCLLSMPPQKA